MLCLAERQGPATPVKRRPVTPELKSSPIYISSGDEDDDDEAVPPEPTPQVPERSEPDRGPMMGRLMVAVSDDDDSDDEDQPPPAKRARKDPAAAAAAASAPAQGK